MKKLLLPIFVFGIISSGISQAVSDSLIDDVESKIEQAEKDSTIEDIKDAAEALHVIGL